MKGWIKLHRQSLDSAVFQNANLWQVWCFCLMRANHKPNKIIWNGRESILEAGQFITGRFEGAKTCRMKPSTFRDQLVRLKSLQSLDIKSDNRNSLITVLNWNRFQENEPLHEKTPTPVPTGHPTTNRQPADTDKNVRMKERDILTSEAESVYDHFKTKVKSGAKEDAIRSIKKLLNSNFTREQLLLCIDRYSANGMSSDRQYRIQCNNFFGRAERFRDYLSEQSKEVIEQAIQQHLAKELIARKFENAEKFKWIAGTDLVHYSGHKDCLSECRKLGLVKKGIEQ